MQASNVSDLSSPGPDEKDVGGIAIDYALQGTMTTPSIRPAFVPDHSRTTIARDWESGMTLIEIMVVLVIMAVVAALIVPNVIGRPDEARVTVASTDLRTISAAVEVYRLDNGVYPTTEQGLSALVEKPTARPEPTNWHREGYLPQLPDDPWGNAYVYRSPADDGAFEIVSLGADGKAGGEGVAADLGSRTAAR